MSADTQIDQVFEEFVQLYLQLYVEHMTADRRPFSMTDLEHKRANLVQWYAAGKQVIQQIEPGLAEASKVFFSCYGLDINNDELTIFDSAGGKTLVAPHWLIAYDDTKAVIEMYRATTGQSPL